MRIGILAAALVCAGMAQARADVFTETTVLAGGRYGTDQGPSRVQFTPVNPTFGTVTAIQFEFRGPVSPAISNTGLSVGSTIVLTPDVSLSTFGGRNADMVGTPLVVPVVSFGLAQTRETEFLTVSLDSGFSPSFFADFLSAPEVGLSVFALRGLVTTTDRFVNLTSAIDTTIANGAVFLNVTYTPVPEPVSLSLLGVGLLAAVVARRKSA